ncbi:MAG: F0F1 ATP synthase subunit delta [Hyphomicrobiaceae bacterium]|nr:F0F1 ATP synthase subunit delta [Hyphomicrobiaceae bacterium]
MATDQTNLASMPGRYASALFDLATETGSVAAVEGDLKAFQSMLDMSADLRRMIRSPVFSADDQARALTAVLEKAGVGGLTGNFLKVVARNRRLFAVPEMIAAFKAIAAAARGEVSAEVTSAQPLADAQVAQIRAELARALGKEVDLAQKVEPEILGGLIVKVGSRMVDNSLRTKLGALRSRLKASA